LENLQAAVLKLESGKTFDATDTNRSEDRIDDADKFQLSFTKGESLGDRRSEIRSRKRI